MINSAVQSAAPAESNNETSTTKREYKSICYSLDKNLAEKMKYIAFYDRKPINAVVEEAFADYIRKWNKKDHTQEMPKQI